MPLHQREDSLLLFSPGGPTLVRAQHRQLLNKTLHWQQDNHRSFSRKLKEFQQTTYASPPVSPTGQRLTGRPAARQQQEDTKDVLKERKGLSKKLVNRWQSRRTRRWSEDLTHLYVHKQTWPDPLSRCAMRVKSNCLMMLNITIPFQ